MKQQYHVHSLAHRFQLHPIFDKNNNDNNYILVGKKQNKTKTNKLNIHHRHAIPPLVKSAVTG